jgi:16S rRNA processing protein RimM
LCSRSSSEPGSARLHLGSVAGHRGAAGELTIRVGGDAAPWTGIRTLWIEDQRGVAREYTVAASRAYRDRLVVKLQGLDDASAAAALRGRRVHAAAPDVPLLPPDTWFVERLIGLSVRTETGDELGTITDVRGTGGADLLVVLPPGAAPGSEDELLIPFARAIVLEVDLERQQAIVRLPDGLADLNRRGG